MIMANTEDKINDALGIDMDNLVDDMMDDADQKEIEKFNERREKIAEVKRKVEAIRGLDNKQWVEQLLKGSAEQLVELQTVAVSEACDNPRASQITATAELANSIRAIVSDVIDIDLKERHLDIMQEKNNMRKAELGEGFLEGEGKTVEHLTVGSTIEILALIKGGIEVDIKRDIVEEDDG